MSTLKQYEIVLPCDDNLGRTNARALAEFEKFLLNHNNGFTRNARCQGAWKDDTGKVYLDELVPYRVACGADAWAAILTMAFALFNDQKAIYYAEIGTAHIVERDAQIKHETAHHSRQWRD